jgi:outer membrane protein assembly factor BamD (BamD/ComL family)
MRKSTLVENLLIALTISTIFVGCSSKTPSKEEQSLFEKAAQAQSANQFQAALDTYQQITRDFPNSSRLDKAIFMIGYIKYENFQDTEGAAQSFQQLIDKFPKSDLIDDAKFLLETINSGQDPFSALQKKIGQK